MEYPLAIGGIRNVKQLDAGVFFMTEALKVNGKRAICNQAGTELKIGELEYWSAGAMGFLPSLHHSITPTLHWSSVIV